jgi:uncharacterized protein YpmB
MKRVLFIVVLCLLIPSTVLAADQGPAFSSAQVKVFLGSRQISFSEQPIVVNHTIMLPLREVAASLGITVIWQKKSPNQVILMKNNQGIKLLLNSNQAYADSSHRYGKVFFMEQSPVLVNGHTMVSLRFIAAVLGTDLTRDENSGTVHIADTGNFANLPLVKDDTEAAGDKYYQMYDLLLGPEGSPSLEEARDYALKEGLLRKVTDVQKTYAGTEGINDSFAMVTGIDENQREKIIWLSKDSYMGLITVKAAVFKNAGLSREKVLSLLQEKKGLNTNNIKTLYLAPKSNTNIMWYVTAEQGYYRVDFFTGSIYEGA